jgi:hypothetical protein
VVTDKSKDGRKKKSNKMVKLHPVAALTPERLKNEQELAATLSKTPTEMMDLWIKKAEYFSWNRLRGYGLYPYNFFNSQVDSSK